MNKYLKHITNLCLRHSITLVTGKAYDDYVELNDGDFSNIVPEKEYDTAAFTVIPDRIIAIHTITTKRHYFSALHEVGHVVTDGNEMQNEAAHRLNKVTKYILESEHKASMFAIKANKYATAAYFDRLAAWNQWFYIEIYESHWKTKLKGRGKYMAFCAK